MRTLSVRVLIAGGGVGGLSLAQGLRREHVEVAVFERDPAAVARGQGYRLRIDAQGDDALAACLPDDLFELYRATSNRPYMSRGNAFDDQLNLIFSAGVAPGPFDPAKASTAVNRLTLRQVLLAGLDDVVHFGHELVHVERSGTGVLARFASGASAEGDVLVGADGINSAVRRQLLPHASMIDTGLRAVYGHATLDTEMLALLPGSLFGGTSSILGPGQLTMALGTFQPSRPLGEAAAQIAPYARLDPVPDYMKWTLVAPTGSFALPEHELWDADPVTLTRLAAQMTQGWHPAIRGLLARSDASITFFLAIRSARPVAAWPPGRVTMLGDAIHATTPVGGTGANVALRDAALLTRCLADVDRRRADLLGAISEYESRMRDYGFGAVANSLRGAERIFRMETIALS
ncbi:MAG TPA: NAD(P)/FAD-dependent oxidoreductase [Streptosporangiaceae bacterium]|nr:NAD(P)/FAD-dependent oxidoreductase [Streptosporangiaceae bacterium]